MRFDAILNDVYDEFDLVVVDSNDEIAPVDDIVPMEYGVGW